MLTLDCNIDLIMEKKKKEKSWAGLAALNIKPSGKRNGKGSGWKGAVSKTVMLES